ncbi:MAG: helix-turn-helix transcriptional regulator [Tissierellia bacterium]|nr:helix-turn-helix transcriptional regulator [Tissierellia bacterium]
MKRDDFVRLLDEKLKLIRTEYGLTQDKMAVVLGISKKTLVEIEKSRKSLGWTNAVAVSTIFSNSTVLRDAIGGDISDIVVALAFQDVEVDYPKTWGGRVWWDTVYQERGYRIQQNLFTQHYRLLDGEDRRVYASFNIEDIRGILIEMIGEHPQTQTKEKVDS